MLYIVTDLTTDQAGVYDRLGVRLCCEFIWIVCAQQKHISDKFGDL